MTRSRAIAKHCLECSGNSPKEVTLCHLFDCPLWEWRTGKHIDSNTYKKRLGNTFKNSPRVQEQLASVGVKPIDFGIGN